MAQLQLHFQPKDSVSSRTDDVLSVFADEDYPDYFHVTSRPSDSGRTEFSFSMSDIALMDHIENIVDGLVHDSDPYEYLQITSNIGPAILYHVSELDTSSVRKNLLRLIWTSLRTLTTEVKRSKRTE